MAKQPEIIIQNKKKQLLEGGCELSLVTAKSAQKTESKSKSKPDFSAKGTYSTHLEKLYSDQSFLASYKTSSFIRFGGASPAEHVLFLGCGENFGSLTHEKLRVLGGLAYQKLFQEKIKTAWIPCDVFKAELGSHRFEELFYAFLEGLLLACYKYDHHKSEDQRKKLTVLQSIQLYTEDSDLISDLKKIIEVLKITLEAITVTRDWSNYPSNIGTPDFFAKESQKLAKKYGLKCKILNEQACAKEKMNLLLSVGQGSENESRVVVLEYTPKGKQDKKNQKTVALVGKGVTFDTGGISIKPAGKMEEMKHDMTGAATLMGALLMASRLKVKNKIIAVFGFVENKPDGFATNPGDVFQARNGKTVEIINTDAEGRLVLADILDYAQDFKPDVIVDAATLTGAVVVSLSNYCCGIMGNDQETIENVKVMAEKHGERVWQLPLYPEFLDEMKSEFADLKNIGSGKGAGTGLAGYFLQQFIKNDTKWVHFDIAGTAWAVDFLTYCPPKGASGLHVRTVYEFAKEF